MERKRGGKTAAIPSKAVEGKRGRKRAVSVLFYTHPSPSPGGEEKNPHLLTLLTGRAEGREKKRENAVISLSFPTNEGKEKGKLSPPSRGGRSYGSHFY